MKSQLYQAQVSVKPSPIHGYGVFAEQDFAPNELIEECYAPFFAEPDHSLINYYFYVDEVGSILCFGNGSIYNHSNNPNAGHVYSSERNVMKFRALRQIKKGEEICTSYGESWFSIRNSKAKKPSFLYRLRNKFFSSRLYLRFLLVVISILFLLNVMQLGLRLA